jgi:hypothetical protein
VNGPTIDLSRPMKDLRKGLNDLQRQQVPFATALALTRIAQNVAAAETAALPEVFDSPTPFTKKAFSIKAATKRAPTATVFARDAQAKYLLPHDKGGVQVLGTKRGILNPKGVRLNSYGNIPKGKLASLKADKAVFFGPVTFKSSGTINGVWRRSDRGKQRGAGGRSRTGNVGTKGSTVAKGIKDRTGLTLLVRFSDPAPITPSLDYEARARKVVDATYRSAFAAALDQAMASAR